MANLLASVVLSLCSASLCLAQQFDGHRKRDFPVDDDGTRALAFGDVDGDGDADLLVGNALFEFGGEATRNRLYRNDGDGRFVDVSATNLPLDTDTTSAVAFLDLEGDGDLDLVVGNDGPPLAPGSQNRIYVNDGTGVFVDAPFLLPVLDDATLDVAVGDVDGDGDVDVVFVNRGQDRLLLNNGVGLLQDVTAAQMPTDAIAARGAALGDIDADGDLDLMLGGAGGLARLYRNNGLGTFVDDTAAAMPADGAQTSELTLLDADADGDLDLLLGSSNVPLGSITFTRLYENVGGFFLEASLGAFPGGFVAAETVAVADYDADGDVDALLGDRWYRNNGSGVFTYSGTTLPIVRTVNGTSFVQTPTAAAVTDIDGDGDVDVALGSVSTTDHLFLGDGAGGFVDVTAERTGGLDLGANGPASGVFVDVDLDGDQDLVLSYQAAFAGAGFWSGQDRVLQNDGSGRFQDVTATALPFGGDHSFGLAVGDVDADGDADILVANSGYPWLESYQQNRLYLNSGTGVFLDVTAARMPIDADGSSCVALADVDGDGDLDAWIGNALNSSLVTAQDRLYLNDGTGTFSDATGNLPADVNATSAVVFGDLDGDGDPDAVTVAGVTNVYTNDGTGVFTRAQIPGVATALALADVDADGDLDLALAGFQSQNRLFLNDGAGGFLEVTGTNMPVDADANVSATFADLDGDQDVDLLLGVVGAASRVYANDGGGVFTALPADWLYGTGEPELDASFVVGDVDGDSDQDVVSLVRSPVPAAAHVPWGYSRLRRNLLRQLDAPFQAVTGRDYVVDAYARGGVPGGLDVVLPAIAFGTVAIPVPGLGVLRMDPATTVPLAALNVPQPSGTASFAISVPVDPTLAGLEFWIQALHVRVGVGEWLTNVVADRIVL